MFLFFDNNKKLQTEAITKKSNSKLSEELERKNEEIKRKDETIVS